MVLFTHNVKKIKGAVYKNGDVDGTCKQALSHYSNFGYNQRSVTKSSILNVCCSIGMWDLLTTRDQKRQRP